MERVFKIRCSAIGKIMGKMGLSETQLAKMNELHNRKINGDKPLNKNMEYELSELLEKHYNPELPQTTKSYLHEWYSNDNEIIQSKYLDKGNIMENDAIDLMANVLGYGLAFKNEESKADEYFTGTADVVLHDSVIDLKCPWNVKTLQSNVFEMDSDYEWQGRGYMHLYGKEKFILFYALMDTPEDLNYGNEITYSHLPINERWLAYQVNHDQSIIDSIIERVKQCREYLEQYDRLVKSKLGTITIK